MMFSIDELSNKGFIVDETLISVFGVYLSSRTLIEDFKNIISPAKWPELHSYTDQTLDNMDINNLAMVGFSKVFENNKEMRDNYFYSPTSFMENSGEMDCIVFGIPDATIPPDKTKLQLAKEMTDFLKKNGIQKAISLNPSLSIIDEKEKNLVDSYFEDVEDEDDAAEDLDTTILFETITDILYSIKEKTDFSEQDIYDEMYYSGVEDGQTLMTSKINCALFKLNQKKKLNHDYDDLFDELKNTVAGMDEKEFQKWLKKMNEYNEKEENNG